MSEMLFPTPNSTNSWIGHKDGPSRLIPGDFRTIVFTSVVRFGRWKKVEKVAPKERSFVFNPVLRWNFGGQIDFMHK